MRDSRRNDGDLHISLQLMYEYKMRVDIDGEVIYFVFLQLMYEYKMRAHREELKI